MEKNDFQKKLNEVDSIVHGLLHDDGVFASSALYGFLLSARTALAMAESHLDEFDVMIVNPISHAASNDNC